MVFEAMGAGALDVVATPVVNDENGAGVRIVEQGTFARPDAEPSIADAEVDPPVGPERQPVQIVTEEADMGSTVTRLIGFLFVYVAVRVVLIFVGLVNDGHLAFRIGALLRHNMLRWVLRLPGANAVRETPGEAISRFRETFTM